MSAASRFNAEAIVRLSIAEESTEVCTPTSVFEVGLDG